METTPVQTWLSYLTTLDIVIIVLNIALIVFARPLLLKLSPENIDPKVLRLRILALRGINVLVLATHGYSKFFSQHNSATIAITMMSILAIIYIAYLVNVFAHYFLFRTYGKQTTIGGKLQYSETYQSRALSLLASLLITVLAIIATVHQLGFDSLLEAGGVIGFIGVMIGLTQASWAPDIISGLILLHSDILDEGNVVELDNGIVGLIFKTKMFHTEILNLSNNHRIMIRNSKIRDYALHNLSKFASARGLRECLTFNIGYEVTPDKVRKCFHAAQAIAIQKNIPFEQQHEVDAKILETGDHAIKWGFIYHVKNVEQIISIRRDMRESVFNAALEAKISLATPLTHLSTITNEDFVLKSIQPSM